LSEDGGMTFPLIRHMELGEGYVGRENSTNNRTYEYPTIMQSRDGMIHIAYAYKTREGVKWMSFSEEEVMGKKRETTGRYNPTSAQIT
ncbi:MAG: exo-alpha-sialidase, partial [Oscillospiraceae bacterium]|nr:exo-alpha-sialidase [Oscillospiraceae bacterium]